MSLRTYFRIIPKILKTVHPRSGHIANFQAASLLTVPHNYAKINLFSTDHKPPEAPKPQRIYYGILTNQIKAVKFFSLSSSFIGVTVQPFLYPAIMSFNNVPIIVAAYSFVGFFTLVTPLLLHFITKKYVTELEYKQDTDTYVAKVVNFFLITKKIEFKVEDVRVPDIPGMFTTLEAKGKSLFMEPRLFESPEHYARLMGYDKPIDLKMYESPPSERKE